MKTRRIPHLLLCLLVQVGDGNTGGKNCPVRVLGGQVGSSLSCKCVQFNRGHPLVHALNNLKKKREEESG